MFRSSPSQKAHTEAFHWCRTLSFKNTFMHYIPPMRNWGIAYTHDIHTHRVKNHFPILQSLWTTQHPGSGLGHTSTKNWNWSKTGQAGDSSCSRVFETGTEGKLGSERLQTGFGVLALCMGPQIIHTPDGARRWEHAGVLSEHQCSNLHSAPKIGLSRFLCILT